MIEGVVPDREGQIHFFTRMRSDILSSLTRRVVAQGYKTREELLREREALMERVEAAFSSQVTVLARLEFTYLFKQRSSDFALTYRRFHTCNVVRSDWDLADPNEKYTVQLQVTWKNLENEVFAFLMKK